jgi:predicted MFS family arabinose efflux permease
MNNRLQGGIRTYIQHLKLFSKNARLFLLGAFFVGLAFAGFQLLFNLYMKELSYKESAIGQILSMNAWGAVIITLPIAYILQKFQIRKVLIFSTLLASMFYFLQATILELKGLLWVSLILGMSVASYRVAAAPFFMKNSTPQERTYLFSMNFGIMMLAAMVGSLGGGYLVSLFNNILKNQVWAYRGSLYVAVFLGLLGVIPFYLIKPEKSENEKGESLIWEIKLLKERGGLLLKLCVPFFIVGLGAGLIIPFLNLYFRDRFLLPAKSIGVYYALLQFFMLAGIILGPVLSKKVGMIKSVVWTQLASIPFMVCLAFTNFLPLAVMAFLLRGALMNMNQPITTNFSMEKVSEKEQPLTNSLTALAWTLSWGISANLGGKLIQAYGYTLPLLIATGLYILSSILYYYFFSSQEDRELGKEKLFIPEVSAQKVPSDFKYE